MMRRFTLALPLALAAAAVDAGPACTQEPAQIAQIQIEEWPVPWERTRPRDPYVDRNGMVWFVGQTGDYAARFDPSTGRFTRFDMPTGAGPHNLIVDDRGVWYAGNVAGHIGRIDPATGRVQTYELPDAAARDVHTLVFDARGDIWFTAQRGGYVGRFSPATGQFRTVTTPTPNSRPYGIVLDANGKVWFNEFGVSKIASLDPATMEITEYDLPHERARGRRIGVTPDGSVWYVDYSRGMLGNLNPSTRAIREFPTPSGAASLPYAMTVDDHGRIWYVESGPKPNRFVGFDPRTSRVFATGTVPSGGGTVRHMVFHKPTRTIWFGTDANTIGRVRVPN